MTADREKETMDEQQALAEFRKAIAAEIARRKASGEWDEADAPAPGGAQTHDPALCPNRPCRRAGECRPPEGGPCLNGPAERMRAQICAKVKALRGAAREGEGLHWTG